jgi:hypothetical protein
MKKYFKFLTAVLAVGALVSCTEELNDSKSLNVKDGDLVATLPSDGEETRVAVINDGSGQFVWSEGDEIQVYQLDNLKYLSYALKDGEGTHTGVFSQVGGTGGATTGKKYAVTQRGGSEDIYGISATTNAKGEPKPLLTAYIAPDYELDIIDAAGKDAYVVPTPLWGPAEIVTDGSNQNIQVGFEKLTALLKVDLRMLEAGTQAIVLSTHNDAKLGNGMSPVEYFETVGTGEKLSGYMNAILDEDLISQNPSPVVLLPDPALTSSDTIRVDITKIINQRGQNTVVYIPIVAQHYDKLTLFAVQTDNIEPYKWDEVQLLKEWNDETFTNKQTLPVLAETEIIDMTDPAHFNDGKVVSSNIASAVNSNEGKYNVRVLIDPSKWTSNENYLYIVHQQLVKNGGKNNNVEITIVNPIGHEFNVVECDAYVHEHVNGDVEWDYFDYSKPYTFADCATLREDAGDMEKRRKITLTFPEGNDEVLNVITPTSVVEINSLENFQEDINAFTCARYNVKDDFGNTWFGVSGYDSYYTQAGYNVKPASLILTGSKTYLKQVNIQPNNRGDVYVYGENTRVMWLRYLTNLNLANIRVSDAYIDHIRYVEGINSGVGSNDHVSIFTTGAAGLKDISGKGGAPIDKNKAKIYAYWTGTGDHISGKLAGKALTDQALAWGYDCGTIYTAAQLQAVGLAAGLVEGGGTHAIPLNNGSTKDISTLTPVYEYVISDLVSSIWLGGDTYPWVGAQVAKLKGNTNSEGLTDRTIVDGTAPEFDDQKLSQDIYINGNNVTLKKMKLSFDDPNLVDPHSCCECGPKYLRINEDLGLFRCIMTTGDATVENIKLNDALIETKQYIHNVGSIVGEMHADDGIYYYNNIVTNPRIFVAGNNTGGQVGHMRSKSNDIDIDMVLTGQQVGEPGLATTSTNFKDIRAIFEFDKTDGLDKNGYVYVISEAQKSSIVNNVGGIVGSVEAPLGHTNITNATVHLNAVIGLNANNVGGLAGNMEYETQSVLTTEKGLYPTYVTWGVDVPIILVSQSQKDEWKKRDSGSNVGGLAGNIKGQDNLYADGTVHSRLLIAAENQNAGGVIGHNNVYANTYLAINNNIKVEAGVITALNGYVGGLVGFAGASSAAGYTDIASPKTVDVKITEGLWGSFAVGGLVGCNENNLYMDTFGKKISVDINDFKNTWQESWFDDIKFAPYLTLSETDRHKYCGSFGTLVGLMQANVNITDIGTFPKATDFTIKGNCLTNTTAAEQVMSLKATWKSGTFIKDAKKKELFFYKHEEVLNTVGVNDPIYFGDVNGYVGYAKESSAYYINGMAMQGDQIYNLFTNY